MHANQALHPAILRFGLHMATTARDWFVAEISRQERQPEKPQQPQEPHGTPEAHRTEGMAPATARVPRQDSAQLRAIVDDYKSGNVSYRQLRRGSMMLVGIPLEGTGLNDVTHKSEYTSKSKAKTLCEALGITPKELLAMLDHFGLGLEGTNKK